MTIVFYHSVIHGLGFFIISTDPGLPKIQHSHRFVALVICFLHLSSVLK